MVQLHAGVIYTTKNGKDVTEKDGALALGKAEETRLVALGVADAVADKETDSATASKPSKKGKKDGV